MKNQFALMLMGGVLVLLVGSKYAWGQNDQWGHHGMHHYYHYHDHPHFGMHVDAFYPNEYFPVFVGGTRYYYDDGVYYSYAGGDYVVVAPPVGAIVSVVPSDFQAMVINGVTYYTDNGTYYVRTPSGYQVVSPPLIHIALPSK